MIKNFIDKESKLFNIICVDFEETHKVFGEEEWWIKNIESLNIEGTEIINGNECKKVKRLWSIIDRNGEVYVLVEFVNGICIKMSLIKNENICNEIFKSFNIF